MCRNADYFVLYESIASIHLQWSLFLLYHQDASCNVLSTLPVDVGGLESLRELYVRRNQLVTVPEGRFYRIDHWVTIEPQLACNWSCLTLEKGRRKKNWLNEQPHQLEKVHVGEYVNVRRPDILMFAGSRSKWNFKGMRNYETDQQCMLKVTFTVSLFLEKHQPCTGCRFLKLLN